jgi:glutamine cyclotransferase
MVKLYAAACLICGMPLACSAAPVSGYKVVHSYPHDPSAFTQGLVYHSGFLYEGTGLNEHSNIRKVKLETGEVLQRHDLPSSFFGEGITIFGKQLIELTWKSETGFVYDLEKFNVIRSFRYPGEGWGLTTDGKSLIMSDGSDTLRFWDPNTFEETRRVRVLDNGKPVSNINELEYVRGEIYANIWQAERIVRISPATGRVLGWINLDGLLAAADRSKTDVLNGIAYDAERDRLFVTGKLWPKLFEIKVIPASNHRRTVAQ